MSSGKQAGRPVIAASLGLVAMACANYEVAWERLTVVTDEWSMMILYWIVYPICAVAFLVTWVFMLLRSPGRDKTAGLRVLVLILSLLIPGALLGASFFVRFQSEGDSLWRILSGSGLLLCAVIQLIVSICNVTVWNRKNP